MVRDVGSARRLHWPGSRAAPPSYAFRTVTNARDLGGLATIDGRRIRAAALIRSSSLDELAPAGIDAVRASGVRRIVDLRSEAEAAWRPSPFEDDPMYHLVPLIDEQRERERVRLPNETLTDVYCASVERNARNIAAGVAAVADAPTGAVIVHCAAGKDRTGMLVALVLGAVGVEPAEIATDYAYSDECLYGYYVIELAALPDEAARVHLRSRQHSRPETILGMLAHVDAAYGSTAGYLTAIGVTEAQIGALRARLRDE